MKYISANEAVQRLGVTRQTLYAYVSRGRIRRRPVPGTRRSSYALADVEALAARSRVRNRPVEAAAQALDHGLPVLSTSLSRIEGGRLWYRELDAIELAKSHTFEQVAKMLWSGPLPGSEVILEGASAPPHAVAPGDSHVSAMQSWLARQADLDLGAHDLEAAAVRRTGAKILHGLASVVTGRELAGEGVAECLAESATGRGVGTVTAIRSALIASAEHGLNVSTFTARCVASAGATPYRVVSAGLGALDGTRHGGHTRRVEQMLELPGRAGAVVADHLREHNALPGFGHPLYPDGDPRARLLLDLVGRRPAVRRAHAVVQAAYQLAGMHPNLDFGLVAVARAFGLGPGAAFDLFAIGRVVGWIAHALEQYADGTLIRPRARYTARAG